MPITAHTPNPMRRTITIGIIAAILPIIAGCSTNTAPTDTNQEQTEPMPDITDQLLRRVVTTAANDTSRALGLEPTATETDAQIITCTDAFGNDKNERFAKLSQGSPITDSELTDEQIDMLAATLDEGFAEDSTSSLGTRRLGFFKDVEGIDVLVRVTRQSDGSASMSTDTSCLS